MANDFPDIDQVFQAAGGRKAVAEALRIKVPSTYSWKQVPAERVLVLSRMSGMPPHKLRPDIFPRPGR
jgi:hypothetical protein